MHIRSPLRKSAAGLLMLVAAGACAPAGPGPAAAPAGGTSPAPSVGADPELTRYAPRNRPDVSGTRGAVVAGHPLAAAAGHDVLRAGGNAVDAAVAMAAVLAVVRPHMNGVGGDAFALFYRPETREVHALNGSGRAGRLATPAFFEERGVSSVPGSGALTVTVPGAVSAWAASLERFGTISLAEALEPAIRLAEEGFVVSGTLDQDLRTDAARLNDAGRAIFAPAGRGPEEGEILRNPALARTLRAIASEGQGAMYGGRVGQALARFVEAEGGYLRAEDFAAHRADWVDPISVDYAGHRVYAVPPNTQGVALLQQMAMAERLRLREAGHNSAEYLHSLVEVKKLAFADRDRWVADPEFSPSRAKELLDPAYVARRAAMIGATAAESVEPGFGPAGPGPGGDGTGDTVYLMAVDQWGNAVSWIQSLFASFGSRLVDPETGIVLQNRGAGFTLEADHPNVIAPGKRPFHTLTPHLATHPDGRLAMTFGTPGGDGQTQTLIQVFNNIVLFGMSPQAAVEAPRYRSMNGRRVSLENRVPLEARAGLVARGHELTIVDGWSGPTFGGAQVILVDGARGTLRTGADPRREAYAQAH